MDFDRYLESRRIWEDLSKSIDSLLLSLLPKLQVHIRKAKIMISKKYKNFPKIFNNFLWQVSRDLDNSKKPGNGTNRDTQASLGFAARAGWAGADQSLWLTLPGV